MLENAHFYPFFLIYLSFLDLRGRKNPQKFFRGGAVAPPAPLATPLSMAKLDF